MMIARWQVEARFGHMNDVLALLKRWNEDIGAQIGWTADKVRVLEGSVGALESTVQSEIEIDDLADLGAAWEKLRTSESHGDWGRELEPYIVSGTSRWEIFRVV